MIRDLINTRGSAILFTMLRRFGKSLNMDMLKTFFEIATEPSLFDGLEGCVLSLGCHQPV